MGYRVLENLWILGFDFRRRMVHPRYPPIEVTPRESMPRADLETSDLLGNDITSFEIQPLPSLYAASGIAQVTSDQPFHFAGLHSAPGYFFHQSGAAGTKNK